jgi:hypothetical protein
VISFHLLELSRNLKQIFFVRDAWDASPAIGGHDEFIMIHTDHAICYSRNFKSWGISMQNLHLVMCMYITQMGFQFSNKNLTSVNKKNLFFLAKTFCQLMILCQTLVGGSVYNNSSVKKGKFWHWNFVLFGFFVLLTGCGLQRGLWISGPQNPL